MSQAEKICKVLIARGKWTKANCQLCRILNKSICPVLIEQNEKKQLEDLDKFDERRELAREEVSVNEN